jgi:Spy/CpxP family protein refolding chaperone
MRVFSTVLALAVSLMTAGNLLAADEKTAPKDRSSHHPMMGQGDLFPGEMLKGLNLTDDQKAKLAELKKEYGPKIKEGWEKADGVLTADQKTARREAMKVARAAGKPRSEAWKEARTAMKLTDDQKAKMEQAQKDAQALHKEVHEKVMALLTPDQKEQLQKEYKEMKHRRGHRAEGNQAPPSGTQ